MTDTNLLMDGGGERFRGSSELPLTEDGLRSAHETAMQIAQKGGVDRIMASSMGRTVQTAKILSRYTHAPVTYVGDGLHPWHLGELEGQPITPERIAYQNDLIKNHPDEPIPGRGPLSTADGESFNTFKDRTLDFLKQVLTSAAAHPDEKTALITHYRVRRLLDAWMRVGAPDDHSIDPETMTTHLDSSHPGHMDRLINDPYMGPRMGDVDLESSAKLGAGVYFLRHEQTPWNKNRS